MNVRYKNDGFILKIKFKHYKWNEIFLSRQICKLAIYNFKTYKI